MYTNMKISGMLAGKDKKKKKKKFWAWFEPVPVKRTPESGEKRK